MRDILTEVASILCAAPSAKVQIASMQVPHSRRVPCSPVVTNRSRARLCGRFYVDYH